MSTLVWQVMVGLILVISACAPSKSIPSVTVLPSATPTRSPTPTSTNTFSPTVTPTASITPLPTIPTFTPTFDISTIFTVTPASTANCLKENPDIEANFSGPYMYGSDEILTYLNSGGGLAQLAKTHSARDPDWGKITDLTGDGLSEIVYRDFIRYSILGCKDGKYFDLFDFAGDSGVSLEGVHDLNKNGVSEVILYDLSHYGFVSLYGFEWNGSKFRSLINMGKYSSTDDTVIDWVSATEYHKLIDTNGDGLKEIVVVYNVNELCGGFGDFCDGTPVRKQTTTLGWNGQNYVVKQRNYTPAQYRFQAIQDADTASSQKEYDQALSLYDEAILSNKLKSFSPEIRDNLRAQLYASYGTTPTPTPYPIALDEYPKLAAYAYYRIMLLHLVQGNKVGAETTFTTLKESLRDNLYAQPYIEMANAFWKAYQSTNKMYDGCAAAIQYSAEHPEILIPLGSDYHGWQSHTYVPADVCPFR